MCVNKGCAEHHMKLLPAVVHWKYICRIKYQEYHVWLSSQEFFLNPQTFSPKALWIILKLSPAHQHWHLFIILTLHSTFRIKCQCLLLLIICSFWSNLREEQNKCFFFCYCRLYQNPTNTKPETMWHIQTCSSPSRFVCNNGEGGTTIKLLTSSPVGWLRSTLKGFSWGRIGITVTGPF